VASTSRFAGTFSALRCGISGAPRAPSRRAGLLPFPPAQVSSFEVPIPVPGTVQKNSGTDDEAADAAASPHRAVFIRAPAIMTASEDVEVLAKVSAVPSPAAREAIEAVDLPDAAGRGACGHTQFCSGHRAWVAS
jgi:hypothetical protein